MASRYFETLGKTPSALSWRSVKLARAFLSGWVVAGPIYIVVALIQAITRPGFELTRHSISLLSNGDLGWIQITNFVLTGLLVVAGAVGTHWAIRSGQGRIWGPLLVAIYGLGLIGAGVFVADPLNGFPPGTPADANAMSNSGMLHFMIGGVGFLALIAACFVFARRFAGLAQPGWARYSIATGVIFLLAFMGIASGSGHALTVIGFWIGVIFAWTWLALMGMRLRTGLAEVGRAR